VYRRERHWLSDAHAESAKTWRLIKAQTALASICCSYVVQQIRSKKSKPWSLAQTPNCTTNSTLQVAQLAVQYCKQNPRVHIHKSSLRSSVPIGERTFVRTDTRGYPGIPGRTQGRTLARIDCANNAKKTH